MKITIVVSVVALYMYMTVEKQGSYILNRLKKEDAINCNFRTIFCVVALFVIASCTCSLAASDEL